MYSNTSLKLQKRSVNKTNPLSNEIRKMFFTKF